MYRLIIREQKYQLNKNHYADLFSVEGLTREQILNLPREYRHMVREIVGELYINHYIDFETEEQIALFKLTYL